MRKRNSAKFSFCALCGILAMLVRTSAANADVVPLNAAPAAVSASERILFDAANRQRTARGLRQLKWNTELASAAKRHAEIMAKRKSLSHQFPGEPALPSRAQAAGARFSSVAENVAYGPSASAIQTGWMHSPHHRANLLDAESDSVGIGVIEQNGLLFAVEDFERAVAPLPLREQVREVDALLSERGLTIVDDSRAAEQACRSDKALSVGRRTVVATRYTTSELTNLPNALIREIRTGRYHSASVAACSPPKSDFTAYQIAVLLYP